MIINYNQNLLISLLDVPFNWNEIIMFILNYSNTNKLKRIGLLGLNCISF